MTAEEFFTNRTPSGSAISLPEVCITQNEYRDIQRDATVDCRRLLHELSCCALLTRTILEEYRNTWGPCPRDTALMHNIGRLLEMSKQHELTTEELKAWEKVKKEERWKP